ncbi:MAG: RsmE family RNA methyltransferase, partial [Candidatus Subteraquimicrobiales bacterium]|nr:RsmE family RNA methyltransferase [Candidatus Subteraquimicrobiales bacterium]
VLRLQKIALEAAKQSQRVTVPKVYEPLTLTESLEFLKLYDLVLVFWEEEKKNTLKETIKNLTPKKIAVVIGPEGGLSSEEIEILKSAQGKPVTLGKRALRVETASIIALALLSYELGALD